MKREILQVSYAGGCRVSEERVIYDKSDDLFTLAGMQRQYEGVVRAIAEQGEAAPASMMDNRDALAAQIAEMEKYIAGYGESEVGA